MASFIGGCLLSCPSSQPEWITGAGWTHVGGGGRGSVRRGGEALGRVANKC